jgi:Epoxide hydrolase N terminus
MSANDSIRPFRIDIPEEALQELRRRVAVPRWPDRETVSDRTQGTQLAKVQELVDYWATDYDWGKLEAKLNALPQFITEIDGLDIHFIHVRSPNANTLPLIMTHGWTGVITAERNLERMIWAAEYGRRRSNRRANIFGDLKLLASTAIWP